MSEHRSLNLQDDARVPLARLSCGLATIFLGALLAGILGTLAFSASGCLISSVIRCLSIQRDLLGLSLLALKMWTLPAFIAALLVMVVAQIRAVVAWWMVLIAAFLAMFGSSVLALAPASMMEPVVLCFASLLLFGSVQLSILISNRLGVSSI